jgi:hypothetical protein
MGPLSSRTATTASATASFTAATGSLPAGSGSVRHAHARSASVGMLPGSMHTALGVGSALGSYASESTLAAGELSKVLLVGEGACVAGLPTEEMAVPSAAAAAAPTSGGSTPLRGPRSDPNSPPLTGVCC